MTPATRDERDAFAAFALMGLLGSGRDTRYAAVQECIVRESYDLADAMLAERDRREKEEGGEK